MSQSVILAVVLLAGADGKTDAEALQGNWTMVSLVIDGKEGSEEQVKSAKLVVEGDLFVPTVDEAVITSKFTLDPSKSPKAIDITYSYGDLKDKTVRGIYKLEGDRFTMCRALRPADDRPREFDAGEGSRRVLVVWKRSKP